MTTIHSSSLTRYPAAYTRPTQQVAVPKPVDAITATAATNHDETTNYIYALNQPLTGNDWQQHASNALSLKAIHSYRNTHNQFAQIDPGTSIAGIDLYA